MRLFVIGVLIVLLVTATAVSQPTSVTTQSTKPNPPAVQTPAPAPSGPTLGDGTPVKLKIARTVSSANARVGETVDFEVVEEVRVGNTVVIPKGGIAWATITQAKPKRRLARGGKLVMNIESVRLADGEKVPLRAVQSVKGGGPVGAMTGAVVVTGILFFPAAPLFLFMRRNDIIIPMGTETTAYTNGNVPLDLAKFVPPAPPAPAAPAVTPQVAATAAIEDVLEITSTPAGAETELDGKFIGNTPLTVRTGAGDHTLKLTKSGHATWEKAMKTSPGKMTIAAELQPTKPAPAKEALSKDDVQLAIDSGKARKKCKDIGLELWDISGYTNHSIWIYTPRAWVERQSCQAVMNQRDVSLTEADIERVLHLEVFPWIIQKASRPSANPCPLLSRVVLKDESQKSVVRPKSEEKKIISMRSKYDWGTYLCGMIHATFPLSEVAALQTLSPSAGFLVTVAGGVAATPTAVTWKVNAKRFQKLP